MPEIIGLITNLGSAAAAVVVTIYFLKHLAAESKSQKEYLADQNKFHTEAFISIIDRVENMEENSRTAYEKATSKLESLVTSFRVEERADHNQLVSLSKDYGTLSTAINEKLDRVTEKMENRKKPQP